MILFKFSEWLRRNTNKSSVSYALISIRTCGTRPPMASPLLTANMHSQHTHFPSIVTNTSNAHLFNSAIPCISHLPLNLKLWPLPYLEILFPSQNLRGPSVPSHNPASCFLLPDSSFLIPVPPNCISSTGSCEPTADRCAIADLD